MRRLTTFPVATPLLPPEVGGASTGHGAGFRGHQLGGFSFLLTTRPLPRSGKESPPTFHYAWVTVARTSKPCGADLADADPAILFGGYTRSGVRSGEYRFEIGPHRSVFMQAPVTPAGHQRAGWRFQSGGRQRIRWYYAPDLADVADAVRQLAREVLGERVTVEHAGSP